MYLKSGFFPTLLLCEAHCGSCSILLLLDFLLEFLWKELLEFLPEGVWGKDEQF